MHCCVHAGSPSRARRSCPSHAAALTAGHRACPTRTMTVRSHVTFASHLHVWTAMSLSKPVRLRTASEFKEKWDCQFPALDGMPSSFDEVDKLPERKKALYIWVDLISVWTEGKCKVPHAWKAVKEMFNDLKAKGVEYVQKTDYSRKAQEKVQEAAQMYVKRGQHLI